MYKTYTPAFAGSQVTLASHGKETELEVAASTDATESEWSGHPQIVEVLIGEDYVSVATNGESYAEQYYEHPEANHAIERLIAPEVEQIRRKVKARLESKAWRAQVYPRSKNES
jgi:hypothetical protein